MIEVICNDDSKTLYRASHIKHINPHIELPKDASKLSDLAGTAAKALTELWGNKENENEERWREIFRLAFADKKNTERFREQFNKMISVQYHKEADRAYEKELRKQREYLIENQGQIYQKLEKYLEQQDWKKSDYETAFIMYQWMVIENYDDFYDLFRGVSLKVINEIDRLWMQYSNQQFGIKGQARIYRDRGGTEDYNREVWDRFGDCVGWRRGGIWLELENADLSDFTFPILIYHHFYQGGGGGIVYGARRISTLASRLESQNI